MILIWIQVQLHSFSKSVNSGKELKNYFKTNVRISVAFFPGIWLHVHICLLGTEGNKPLIIVTDLQWPWSARLTSLMSLHTWSSPIWNSDWGRRVMSSLCWPLQLPPSLKPPWQLFGTRLEHTRVPLVLESFLHWVTELGLGLGLNLPEQMTLTLIDNNHSRQECLITWHNHIDIVKLGSVVFVHSVPLLQSIIHVSLRLDVMALQTLIQICKVSSGSCLVWTNWYERALQSLLGLLRSFKRFLDLELGLVNIDFIIKQLWDALWTLRIFKR